MQDFKDKVAVVTGGASGIGKALVSALLDEGARVIIGDVEQAALDRVLAELEGRGEVSGVVTDVSNPESVEALAEQVFTRYGECNLLFNNAGVAAPSLNIWDTKPNDWKWVHGVNVMGVVHGIQSFVPRMIESGKDGHVINTSSGDGGISPLPYQSVYASSKAAVSCITECLAAQLVTENTRLRASIFYPSGGVLATGIWTTERNRPKDLTVDREPVYVPTVDEFKASAEAAGMALNFQDLDELARFTLRGVKEQRVIIMLNTEESVATLRDRADRYERFELPIDLAAVPQL